MQGLWAANFIVIYFGCGLAFVLMGFGAAIAVRTFRDSSLRLARSLPLLAAFGLLEGVAQWGVIFIPLQATYISASAQIALLLLQTFVVGLAAACLFGFGLRLAPGTDRRWWAWLPIIVFALWLGWFLWLVPGDWDAALGQWRLVGLQGATYLMTLPGAVLSAWGVFSERQGMRRFYPQAAWFLTGTAAAFLLLIPLGPRTIPAAPLHALETPRIDHFSTVLGVPVQVFLGLDGLMLAFFTMQALEVFRRENQRRLEDAEREQTIMAERYRIGRDLNDSVMQSLMGVGMLLEAMTALDEDGIVQLARRKLAELSDRTRAYIVGLDPMNWENPDLQQGLQQLVDEFRAHTLLPVALAVDAGIGLDSAAARLVYGVTAEALANVRRHAKADHVSVSWQRTGPGALLIIRDNGRGLDPETVDGPGVRRMRHAAAALGGTLSLRSALGTGTAVHLTLPAGALIESIQS